MLLIVLGDVVQQAITQEDMSITGGLIVLATMGLIVVAVDELIRRSARARRIVEGHPTTVVRDGAVQDEAMRIERLPMADLLEAARSKGIDDLASVRYAILEPNGRFSFITNDAATPTMTTTTRPPPLIRQSVEIGQRPTPTCSAAMWVHTAATISSVPIRSATAVRHRRDHQFVGARSFSECRQPFGDDGLVTDDAVRRHRRRRSQVGMPGRIVGRQQLHPSTGPQGQHGESRWAGKVLGPIDRLGGEDAGRHDHVRLVERRRWSERLAVDGRGVEGADCRADVEVMGERVAQTEQTGQLRGELARPEQDDLRRR